MLDSIHQVPQEGTWLGGFYLCYINLFYNFNKNTKMKRLFFVIIAFIVTINSCRKDSNSKPQREDVLSQEQLQILDNAPLDTISKFTDMLFPDGSNIADWGNINDSGYVYALNKGDYVSTASDKKALFIKRMIEGGKILTDDALWNFVPPQKNGLAYVYGSKNIRSNIYLHPDAVCRQYLYGLDCSGLIYQMATTSSLNLAEGGTIHYVNPSTWNTAFNSSPDFQGLEMNDLFQLDPSQFEAGDIIVEPNKHMGIVYSTGTTLGIINSQGSPDNTCEENSAIGRGPVLRADITTNRWIELLFPNSGYHVLRVIQNGTPGVSTNNVTSISQTSAVSGGNITNEGGSSITARGVCWSTTTNPTIANDKTINDTGPGIFTSSITGLIANTTYYVKAYATNASGTAYGNPITFTTQQNTVLNPEALWSFDDCTANDFSGKNHNGIFRFVNPNCQTGIASNSSYFSNKDLSYFDSPWDLTINSSSFSISFWVKFLPGTTFSGTNGNPFFTLETGESDPLKNLHFWNHYNFNDPSQSYWALEAGLSERYKNQNYSDLTNGNWHHFALSCLNTNLTLYMDGNVLTNFTSPSSIYHRIIAQADPQKNATFDQIRYYNISLNTTQIQYLFNNHL